MSRGNDFAKALSERDNFLILTHKRPDGDTVGSAAALCAALRRCGKTAFLLKNGEAGGKLSPFFEEFAAPEGFSPDTVAATDVSSHTQFQHEAGELAARVDFLIDHHIGNNVNAAHRFVDESAAATGELVFSVAKALCGEPDRQIAELVYLAVSTDTGCFKYQNTTALTHRIAAECMDAGADAAAINALFFDLKSKARIALERAMFDSLRMFCSDRIALMSVPLALFESTGATQDDTDNLAALPRRIEGVDAGVVCYEQKSGEMRFSVRTTDAADAAKICSRFGGGGHARAAGCTLAGPFESAAEKIVSAIEEALL